MQINSEIKDLFEANNIDVDKGILYLLGLHFGLDTEDVIAESLKKQIYITKIVERDYASKTIKWNKPLFDTQEITFAWVDDWRNEFGKINLERKGDKQAAIANMKKFLAENLDVGKDEVFAATRLYFRSVTNPMYLKHSHKFIYEGQAKIKPSMLGQWIEIYRESKKNLVSNPNKRGDVLS